jgi:hypothetical protein
MLIAILLFIAGLSLGWRLNWPAVALSSFFVLLGSVSFFITIVGFEPLQVLLVPGYLLAHQAGYLVGAYLSGGVKTDRQSGSAHQNQIALPAD